MKTLLRILAAAGLLAAAAVCAQVTPRTVDATMEIAPDGSTSMTIRMSFDAEPWQAWKTTVGDNPSRLRAMMRHQFAAYVLEDFKLERDDLNRTAALSMRSVAGPELRNDGSYRLPVEKEFRLVNHAGREWFFSGNNPAAGNTLNTIKLVLPPAVVEATLINAGTSEQAVVYTLPPFRSVAALYVPAGIVLLVLSAGALGAGLWLNRRTTAPPPTPT